jgi:signal recognition particle subunit SRP72
MSSSIPPEELVLTSLQSLLDAWSEDQYDEVVKKSSFLLKKKIKLDSSLRDSVQRIMLQSWLQQEEYSKVISWIDQQTKDNNHSDLGYYARYRLNEFDKVSKSASNESTLEKHLLAQSYFRLKQANPALKVYQELLNDDDNDDETKMELFSNALAVITGSDAIPYVPLNEESQQKWVTLAEELVQERPDFYDLAFNLGTLKSLTGPYDGNEIDWLEEAEANCNLDNDSIPIETNIAWSRQFWSKDLDDADYSAAATSESEASIVAKINHSLLTDDDNYKLPSHPNAKWNALQVRMYWYNRAISQFKAKKLVECQESCQSLKRTVSGGSKGGDKKKKKSDNSKKSPANLWWEARVDTLLAHVQAQQSKTSQGIEKLEQQVTTLQKQQPSCYTIDHAIAHILLHLHSIRTSASISSLEESVAVLKSLPESIQSQPAVQATLKAMGANDDQTSFNKKDMAPPEQADALFFQGKFKEASDMYTGVLSDVSNCDSDQLAQHLRHIQALATSGQHDESSKLWIAVQPYLEGSFEASTKLDGETLEKQDLPRSSTMINKQLVVNESNSKIPKRSQKSILRQRAQKRDTYLKQLEARGEYNKDRPTKPNPERWIPKNERSRNRRNRRGGGINRSAQGGGSHTDASRLDAAARRAGTAPVSSVPSTANLKVSNGSRKGGRRR